MPTPHLSGFDENVNEELGRLLNVRAQQLDDAGILRLLHGHDVVRPLAKLHGDFGGLTQADDGVIHKTAAIGFGGDLDLFGCRLLVHG